MQPPPKKKTKLSKNNYTQNANMKSSGRDSLTSEYKMTQDQLTYY